MPNNKNTLFEDIHKQYSPMVLQMCLGFVKGDRDIANDLSQEIFISIWSNLEKFKGESSYKTWIYRITVNTCLQYVKKDKKEKEMLSSSVENQPALVDSGKEEAQDNSRLYRAIGQLKEIDRLIIMMVLENQDYENISEVIGINAINVRVKIHRIKKRLETILKNDKND
ncbi:RNA polymerase sigma factor [Aureivirga sp. CE67]|uniref:RNA polymerase sigma factor n=1 Tax=Aureivirga sp. CE67 TaxID=1788983 RepID=UPI0018C8F6BA|nr:RNA polymerase sigma factor [Aureivirga sp. CE67]